MGRESKKNNINYKGVFVKTVLVGCGHMAQVHIPYVLKIKNMKLAAVCDSNEIRAVEMAQRYNIPYYTDISRMMDEINPDAVHILTPPQTHADITIQALKAGCHVLVEKPFCLTTEEVDAIHKVSRSTNRLVSVNYTHFWLPLIQEARKLVESGRLGRLIHIHYVISDDYLEVKSGYGRWAQELPGGIFCDLIPHPLTDIYTFLPGAKVISAQAYGTGIKDLRDLWINFSSESVLASLWMSLNQRPLKYKIQLFCTGGTIYIDLRNFYLVKLIDRGFTGPISRVVNTLSEICQRTGSFAWNTLRLLFGRLNPHEGTAGAIRSFYQAIIEGKPSPVSEDSAKAVVKLSTDVWDLLERTSGAIHSAVNEKGRVIKLRTVDEFVIESKNEPPNVLVTGGTGFIGQHLVKRLVLEGQAVRVLCRSTSNIDALPTEGVELAFGDLSDLKSVRQTMKGINVIYHLAAVMSGEWADHYYGTVIGTQNVLKSAAEAGVEKVVYVSSLGVLHASHFPNGKLIDESFPVEQRPKARGGYSRAKLEAEQVAQEFVKAGELPLCIVRPGLVYGPGRTKFLRDAGFLVGNRFVFVVGMGGRRLSLNFVGNLVDALLLAEQSEDSCGKTYHIVDPDQPTIRQYIKTYRRITGHKLRVLYLPTIFWKIGFSLMDVLFWLIRRQSSHLGYRLRSISRGPLCDSTANREDLGWESQMSFEECMCKTYKPV